MSLFRAARFGNAAVNTVNGVFEIEKDINLSVLALFDTTILSSITTSVIYFDATGLKSLTLPSLDAVPVGTKVIIKINTRVTLYPSALDQIDGLGLGNRVRLDIWDSVTLYNDGTRWLIIEYHDPI
jgi:hypothetical protein